MKNSQSSLRNPWAWHRHQKRRNSARDRRLFRRLFFEGLEDRRVLTIVVNTPLDFRDNNITDGSVTLRDAIGQASAGDTIKFSTSISDGLNGATISLLPSLGEIAFNKSLTIDASMLPNGITIDASSADASSTNPYDGIRIFNITDATSGSAPPLVTLVGLKMTGGDVDGEGGAIQSQGLLVIRDCANLRVAAN